jgi:hypothetical protein
MPLTRTCRISWKEFIITDREVAFLTSITPSFAWKKYPLSLPALCPEERMRRRLSWRNSFTLYKAKCAISWKNIVSSFNSASWYLGTDQKTWWTEVEWLDYGISFDEQESFFEQYANLIKSTPLPCLSNSYSVNINSDYVNGTINVKDCYLIFNSMKSEHSEYAETINKSEYIFDSSYVFESAYCHDCIGITRCHMCISVEESEDCRDSLFLYDCRWCSHCILSFGLENQSFCIRNQKVSEEEYFSFLSTMKLEDGTLNVDLLKKEFEEMRKNVEKNDHIIGSENCSGKFIKFSSNVENGKNLIGAEDTMNTWQMNYITRCYDCFSWGGWSISSPGAESCYECMSIGSGAYGLIGCWWVWENTRNMYYCYSCIGCQDCLGCVWIRQKQYCIFNKQYTKKEYELLAPQIIEKMIEHNEWGEYPPSIMSPFSYDETVANLEFPMTQAEAIKKWYTWSTVDSTPQIHDKKIPGSKLPPEITDIPDDILSWAIECEASGKYYMITRPELEFYRKHHLPIPRKHYDMRRKERFERRFR